MNDFWPTVYVFVLATFIAFTLFPLGVAASHSFGVLALAFVVGGLREIGEPQRILP